MISQADFFDQFQEWLDADEKDRMDEDPHRREMPMRFPKGKSPKDRQNYFGNIAWAPPAEGASKLAKLIVVEGMLVPETQARSGGWVRKQEKL